MKINKFLVCLLTVILIFSNCNIICYGQNNNSQVNNLYSLSAALIDGDSGRVLYEKNGYEQRPMASTTKIMTLIIALEYGNSKDIISVSSYASKMPDVQLGINEGEQYKLADLYYSLMLESHNDVAVAIAEHIGGSVGGFALMMNKKAAELGLNSTYFITPNGLDDIDNKGVHSTTAIDLAKLMKYCVMESPKREEFIAICQTRDYSFCNYDKSRSFNVYNKNAFLDMVDGVVAGKTGFTADAGYCYVVAVTRDDKTFIVALLGCGWPNNKNYKWEDTKKLIEYGFDNYYYSQITDIGTPMKTVDVINGTPKDYVNTYINDYVNILISKQDNIKLEYNLPYKIKPPISQGDIIGSINVIVNDEIIRTINVYSSDTSYVKDYRYYVNLLVDVIF